MNGGVVAAAVGLADEGMVREILSAHVGTKVAAVGSPDVREGDGSG
jgi:hypothetical protein